MAKPIVSDELWEIIEPLIPKKKRRLRYPGRKPIPDRAAPIENPGVQQRAFRCAPGIGAAMRSAVNGYD